MTLDERLRSASEDARVRVQRLDVPPLRSGGSGAMTGLRTTMTKRGGDMRNRPVLVFAGAVLAVVLVVGVTAVLQARSDDPVSGPAPTGSTDTTGAPSTTLAAQAPLGDLDDYPVDENFTVELAPGTYVVTRVEPFEIMITVPEGWERGYTPSMVWSSAGSDASVEFVAVDNVYADPFLCDPVGLDPPVGPTVDDLVAALVALPGIETTAPRDVTVDGFAGQYVELQETSEVEGDQCEPALWITPYDDPAVRDDDPMEPASAPGHPLKVWIVDVDSERLVINARDRDETSPEQYAGRDQIFDSIHVDVP